jgi:hypothetical protein
MFLGGRGSGSEKGGQGRDGGPLAADKGIAEVVWVFFCGYMGTPMERLMCGCGYDDCEVTRWGCSGHVQILELLMIFAV